MSLGSGGVETDIVTGLPKTKGMTDARADYFKKKVDEAERLRHELLEDLKGSGGLVFGAFTKVVASHVEKILMEDTIYKVWYDIAKEIGETIQLVPTLMRSHFKKATGLPLEGIPGLK